MLYAALLKITYFFNEEHMKTIIEAHEETYDPLDKRDFIDSFLEESKIGTPTFEVSLYIVTVITITHNYLIEVI